MALWLTNKTSSDGRRHLDQTILSMFDLQTIFSKAIEAKATIFLSSSKSLGKMISKVSVYELNVAEIIDTFHTRC